MKEILETPLESFGDLETEEIAKKYESSQPAAAQNTVGGGADTGAVPGNPEDGEAPKEPDVPEHT